MTQAAGAQFSSQQPDIMAAVLDVARRVVRADGFAIWQFERGHWEIRAFAGVSAAFARHSLAGDRAVHLGAVRSGEPLSYEDIRTAQIPIERRDVLEREGVRSMAAIPLSIAGDFSAGLVPRCGRGYFSSSRRQRRHDRRARRSGCSR